MGVVPLFYCLHYDTAYLPSFGTLRPRRRTEDVAAAPDSAAPWPAARAAAVAPALPPTPRRTSPPVVPPPLAPPQREQLLLEQMLPEKTPGLDWLAPVLAPAATVSAVSSAPVPAGSTTRGMPAASVSYHNPISSSGIISINTGALVAAR